MNRREAREQAFVLIFERSINHDTVSRIIDAASLADDAIVDEYAEETALGVEKEEEAIDARIAAHIRAWKMDRLSRVSLALLRLSIYEMTCRKDVPVSVSINEAVNLAKKYGCAEDAPFVNGLLGSVAKELEKADETDA